MRLHTRALALLSSLLLAAGCAAHQPSTDAASHGDRNVLSGEQLRAQSYRTAYEAIEALRTNWLKPRGSDSFNSPSVVVVYLDNVKLGGVDALRSLTLNDVQSIRHYDASQANARWGVGHASGAIQVTTITGNGTSPQ